MLQKKVYIFWKLVISSSLLMILFTGVAAQSYSAQAAVHHVSDQSPIHPDMNCGNGQSGSVGVITIRPQKQMGHGMDYGKYGVYQSMCTAGDVAYKLSGQAYEQGICTENAAEVFGLAAFFGLVTNPFGAGLGLTVASGSGLIALDCNSLSERYENMRKQIDDMAKSCVSREGSGIYYEVEGSDHALSLSNFRCQSANGSQSKELNKGQDSSSVPALNETAFNYTVEVPLVTVADGEIANGGTVTADLNNKSGVTFDPIDVG